MESLVTAVSITALVFSTKLIEPLELARGDVTEYDDGPVVCLALLEDPLEPGELTGRVHQVLNVSVGFVPEVGVQAQ